MDIKYDLKAPRRADDEKLLRGTETFLAKAFATRPAASAVWTTVAQSPKSVYRLTVTEAGDSVSREFTSDNLNNPLLVRFVTSRLLGDLLKVQYDEIHRRTEEVFNELVTVD